MDLQKISQQTKDAINFLIAESKVSPGDMLVVGCSTSEVIGKQIGTSSSIEVAKVIFTSLYENCKEKGLYLAIQCCEHLNRALVVEKSVVAKYGLEEVLVIPVQKAGGALAHVAMETMEEPVVVESIKAQAGIDIGDTFIGMHLKNVAVPIRGSINEIGNAHVTLARTRPKLIGGARAVYETCL